MSTVTKIKYSLMNLGMKAFDENNLNFITSPNSWNNCEPTSPSNALRSAWSLSSPTPKSCSTTTIAKSRHLRCTFFVHEAISSSWFFCVVRFGNSLHEFLRYPVEIGDKRPGPLPFVITLSVCVLFIDKTQLSSSAPKFVCLLKQAYSLASDLNWIIQPNW